MKNYILIKKEVGFDFIEVKENQWKETMWQKEYNGNGESEWIPYHTVEYLKTEDVDHLVKELLNIGFELA